jgi:hypothetical protein
LPATTAGDELPRIARVGAGVRLEVLLPQPQHLVQPRIVGPHARIVGRLEKLRVEHRPQRIVPLVAQRAREAVVAEAAVLLLFDEPGLLEQPEVPRHARLGEAEDARQLRDVEAFAREDANQPQPRLVAEQPVKGGDVPHIYKSICVDISRQATAESCP